MKIAVDALGGDYAPAEVVRGAVEAACEEDVTVVLVGREEVVREELEKHHYPPERVEVVDAPEAIGMEEHPVTAVRRKRNSSLVVATRLVRDGAACAVVSAGNTGAQMAAALFELGRLPGIERPGIATVLPSPRGPKVLIDSGANVDCKASHLVRFALLGSAYARCALGIGNPRVALLNVGSEPTKGSEAVVAAYQLLEKQQKVCFCGNLEGRDLFTADVDVVVCDGFVGNVVLKLTEGLAATFFGMVREELQQGYRGHLAGLLARPYFRRLLRRLDYAEYGGAPLLGVQGLSIICHGSSRAKAIKNAVKYAKSAAAAGLLEFLAKELQEEDEGA